MATRSTMQDMVQEGEGAGTRSERSFSTPGGEQHFTLGAW